MSLFAHPVGSSRLRRAFELLPQGRTLPPNVWRARHRFMLAVIWAHLAALGVAGVVIGQDGGHLAFELVPILLCALAGALPTGSRRLRGSMVSFGALYCSAALVDMAHGSTETHFHFFVMVSMLAAYEEWVPYLLAIGFVVVHHGVVGVLDPGAVYDHSSAVASPWKWALIHAAFIVGLSVVNVISWRLNENARAEATDALQRFAHAAEHDALTGLPNRACFERRADEAIAALEAGRSLAVLFVDLDNFKVINDSLGHGAGDRLLVLVAERLRRALGPADVLARFGGDEFVILLPESDEQRALAMAERLCAELGRPCDLDGQRRFVTASVGLTLSDRSDASAVELIRDGDAAMYRAKARGKNNHVLFDEQLRDAAVRRLELEDGLRDALELGQFELHYQLEVDLNTGATFGVEALIRWRRPDGSLLTPADFIPIAEQSGLIAPVGRWVLDEACRQAAAWRADGVTHSDSLMSINLSQIQLTHGEIVSDIAAALARHDLPARLLCLEITESAVMLDPERAKQTLAKLKQLGVKLAIDDFGTGHSSLAHLKHLMPVDIIKIDQSFVHGLADGAEDAAIITAVVELADKLGLTTIAEGIEDAGQAECVRQMRCEVGQGYGLGRPEPAARVAQMLARPALNQAA